MLDGGKKHYAHMINGTLCACQRLICALLENHQDEDGVKLPTVLQPYMHGIARLPFVKLANIEDYDLDKKNAVKAMRTAARKKDRFQATTLTPLEPSSRHLQRRITKDSGGANTHHVATNRQQKQIKKKYSAAEGENYLRLFTKRGLEWLDDRLKTRSYIMGKNGYVASAEDAVVYDALNQCQFILKTDHDDAYPNIQRWYRNIASASLQERQHWPATKEHVLSGRHSYFFDLQFPSYLKQIKQYDMGLPLKRSPIGTYS